MASFRSHFVRLAGALLVLTLVACGDDPGNGDGDAGAGSDGAMGQDGGQQCGDDVCTSQEDCGTCPADCGTCPATCQLGVMPIGVPEPEFGITDQATASPAPWDQPTPGFYYVEPTHPQATDENNDYGTPAAPRATIPRDLPAGAVVELHGDYDRGHTSPNTLTLSGTAAQPVFIRGVSATGRPTILSPWEVRGSYFILEHLHFAPADENQTGRIAILAPTDHGTLRHSEVEGNVNTGGVGVASWSGETLDHVVLYDNQIHDNGDINADFDQDVHGIAVGSRTSRLWVLHNELYRNSGDGIQINAGVADQATTHDIYVGCNVAHHNKQSGYWTKQAVDVIFSQNVAYAHRPSNSSSGAGMGFQYAPERVWFLFNQVYDCEVGIGSGSDSDQGFGEDIYLLGNVIHNIHATGDFNPNTGWQQAGISMVGGTNIVIANNTIHDVHTAIASPSNSYITIEGNILSGVTHAEGSHIFLEAADPTRCNMSHNLLEGDVRIKWGSNTALDLPAFQAAFPGQGTGCLNEDPLFVDATASDFHLQPGSGAIDQGLAHPAYDTFFTLYGIHIDLDPDGTSRPSGSSWDLGAYEQ